MAGKISMFDYLEEADKENQRLRKKLQRLAAHPDIACVLGDNALSIDDYVEHFHYLGLCGLSDLAWDIIGDAKELSCVGSIKQPSLLYRRHLMRCY